MKPYEKRLEIRWSDLDPNFHLRHSVYYDYGAFTRISFLDENGITPAIMLQYNIGPVLFREECVFKRELKFGDEIMINLVLEKSLPDLSRWTMKHEIWKNANTLAAIITVDAAWIDTRLRKLTKPPGLFRAAFEQIPKAEGFKFTEKNPPAPGD
ncbi:MAG: thioesterase family protein [Ferruginibacter sp.]